MDSTFFEAHGPSELPLNLGESIVVLGNLDGVHLGHQALFRAARELARRHLEKTGDKLPILVMTFDPHPARVLGTQGDFRRIFPLSVQTRLLRQAGLQGVFYQEFSKDFSRASAGEFLEKILFPLLHPRGVVVGFNFRFGHQRQGDPELLKAWGMGRGVDVEVVPAFQLEGETVSSSRIREFLRKGEMEDVRRLLGFPFFLEGRVVEGARRGHQLGFPTANLDFPPGGEGVLMPPFGVYATRSFWDAGPAQGQISVSHLGPLPTFDDQRPRLETHLLDFKGDLYGRNLRVEFLRKLRDPVKFSSLSELQSQILRDIEGAREVHRESADSSNP